MPGPPGRSGVDLARQTQLTPRHEVRGGAAGRGPAAAGRTKRVQAAGPPAEIPGVCLEGSRSPLRVPRRATESAHVDGVPVSGQVESILPRDRRARVPEDRVSTPGLLNPQGSRLGQTRNFPV